MTRSTALGIGALMGLLIACGGSQKGPSQEGPGERAGRKLDEAAGKVKETGEKVGEKVGNKLGSAGENVKDKLGLDDGKDAGAPSTPKDGG